MGIPSSFMPNVTLWNGKVVKKCGRVLANPQVDICFSNSKDPYLRMGTDHIVKWLRKESDKRSLEPNFGGFISLLLNHFINVYVP